MQPYRPTNCLFCEGSVTQGKSFNFDAKIYKKVFEKSKPDVEFVSVGSCSEVVDENNVSMSIVKSLLTKSKIIKVVDRDDKSDEEEKECNARGINVLSRRHIECYLLDDEIITKLCLVNGKDDKIEECLEIKRKHLHESVARGNPKDDIKSASGPITVGLKKILQLIRCGNTREAFLRDTMAPLITEDTNVYKCLENDIFGRH